MEKKSIKKKNSFFISYPNKLPNNHNTNIIPAPHKNIWNKIYPHPIPPIKAPEKAPAPLSPSLELEAPHIAPIMIAMIIIQIHIN